jgi:hypothetical protein
MAQSIQVSKAARPTACPLSSSASFIPVACALVAMALTTLHSYGQTKISIGNFTLSRAPGSTSGGPVTRPHTPNGSGVHALDTTSVSPSTPIYNFGDETVGAANPAQATASFTVSGYTGTLIPTVAFQNGVSYSAGPVTCTPNSNGETCTVTVTFQPLYPGGHRDALYVTDGTAQLAQTVLYGIGDAPMALIQPGVVHGMQLPGQPDLRSSAVDDKGNLYVSDGGNAIYKFAPGAALAGGPATKLVDDPNLSNVSNLSVDGAGNLLLSQGQPNNGSIYQPTGLGGPFDFSNAVAGGNDNTPPIVRNNLAVATGNSGNVYVSTPGVYAGAQFNYVYVPPALLDSDSALDTVTGLQGSPVTKFVFPAADLVGGDGEGPTLMAVDANETIFAAGQDGLFQMKLPQLSSPTNANSFNWEIAVDAADTIYTNYSGHYGVSMLSDSNQYQTVFAQLDAGAFPGNYGNSVGPDGTVYMSNGQQLDVIDRSTSAISFGEQSANTTSSIQAVQIYNGGNEPLTIATIVLSGDSAFVLQTANSSPCSNGLVLPRGALCQIAVNMTPTHAGTFNGSIAIATNSLNKAATVQTVALSGFVYGPYVAASPNPFNFGNVALGDSSISTPPITLTNNGLRYYAYNLGGNFTSNNPAFTVTGNTCGGVNLDVGQSCTVSIRFSPIPGQPNTGTISYTYSSSGGGPDTPGSFAVTGTSTTATSSAGPNGYDFGHEQVGTATPTTVNATFAVSGYAGAFTPAASLHYGLSYSLGTLACTPDPVTLGAETCTVPITFQPLLPGARRDAIQLTDPTHANAVLATVMLYGVGESPLALLQPGTVTHPIVNYPHYLRASTVGEDGTLYLLNDSGTTVLSVSPSGTVTNLAVSGLGSASGNGIAVDGAGTLYIATNNNSSNLITYSAAGVQGTFSVEPPSSYNPCVNGYGYSGEIPLGVAFGIESDLFMLENYCGVVYEFKPDGTFAATKIDPSIGGLSAFAVDDAEDVFAGGYTINELTARGVQSQINTIGSGSLSVDAAGTLYAGQNGNGVFEFPASNYTNSQAQLDGGQTLGSSVGPDGTVYLSNDSTLDKVDRSQYAIDWGSNNGQTSNPQTVSVYNGGNEPLTLSSIAISGTGYAIQTASTNPCSNGITLAAGALCAIGVTSNPPHAGTLTGALTIASNSLNNPSTIQTVALTGYVSGIYVTADPDPLAFGSLSANQTLRVTLTNYSDGSSAYGYGSSVSIVSALVSSNPAFSASVGNCPSSLASGSSCQIEVTFTPTAGQSPSGTITWTEQITGGGPSQQLSVAVSGTGVSANTPEADSESIHVSDSVSLVPSTVLPINETITVSDTPVNVPSTLLPIGETITVSDAPVNVPSTLLPIGETITVSDAPVNVPSTLLPIGETITVSDNPVGFTPTVPATLTSPTPGTTLQGSSATFTWTTGTGVVAWQIDIGSKLGGHQYNPATPQLTTTYNATGLPTDGSTIYVRLYSRINNAWQFNDYTYTAYETTPVPSTMISPSSGSTLTGSTATFTWTPGTNVVAWQIDIGSKLGGHQYNPATPQLTTTYNATGLPTDGSTIYVRLYSRINNAWQYNDYTYTAYEAPPVPAAMTSPSPGSTLSGSTATFTWTPGVNVVAWQIDIGSKLGGHQYNPANPQYTTTYNATELPTDGSTIYVRLYSRINNAWQYNDYTYTAYETPPVPATMISPAPTSTLTGSSATFTWTPGTNVVAWQIDIGTSPGNHKYNPATPQLTTTYNATGLPTDGSTVYVRLYSRINNAWQYNDYTYTAFHDK